MAKLADIRVEARNKHDSHIMHQATYPCSVDSGGIFRAEIEEAIFATIKRICEQRPDLGCKAESLASRGRAGVKFVVAGATLRNVETILREYGSALVEADVKRELRIFYTLELGASYYRTAGGELLPNARGVPDYGKDGGQWHGDPTTNCYGRDAGFRVGVGARVVLVTTVTPKSGDAAISYDRAPDAELGEWARALHEWTGQPFPQQSFGSASKMRSIPYTEEGAKMFADVLRGLVKIADMLERSLDDADQLPALLAGGGLLLLGSS